jgi:lipopolysaccharide/colanic/teichoic acid biosynthesis glycosyltransferase
MPRNTRRAVRKRAFDLIVASTALVLLSPILLLIAVAVLVDSGPPVLFRQTRIGRAGRPFRMLKFRTMVPDAERISGNVSPDGDARVTRCGRVLRRWYLDELLQLINVVRGDMSLVGPRPETPEFVELLEPDELRVLEVHPGLVGPSTVQFMDEARLLAGVVDPEEYYRTTLVHERNRADLSYLELQSFRYDLRLLLRQVALIVRSV